MKTSSQKVNLDTEIVISTKLSKKKFAESPKIALLKFTKNLRKRFEQKNFFALDFPRDS